MVIRQWSMNYTCFGNDERKLLRFIVSDKALTSISFSGRNRQENQTPLKTL
jgi:hypothetical protein